MLLFYFEDTGIKHFAFGLILTYIKKNVGIIHIFMI